MLLFLLFINLAYADNGQYKDAIKTATLAAAKQSGLEADFFKVRSASNKKLVKLARDNGLEKPLAVVTFITPIIYRQKLRVKTGDFTLKVEKSKTTLDWQFSF